MKKTIKTLSQLTAVTGTIRLFLALPVLLCALFAGSGPLWVRVAEVGFLTTVAVDSLYWLLFYFEHERKLGRIEEEGEL